MMHVDKQQVEVLYLLHSLQKQNLFNNIMDSLYTCVQLTASINHKPYTDMAGIHTQQMGENFGNIKFDKFGK